MIFLALPGHYKDPILTKMSATEANFFQKKLVKKSVFRHYLKKLTKKLCFFFRARSPSKLVYKCTFRKFQGKILPERATNLIGGWANPWVEGCICKKKHFVFFYSMNLKSRFTKTLSRPKIFSDMKCGAFENILNKVANFWNALCQNE